MKKLHLVIALVLVLVVTTVTYAFTYLTTTATIDITVSGAEIATATEAATQPDWDSVLFQDTGTETLRPNAEGTYSQCDPVGDAPNYQCVDEAVADEDSTYVETGLGATELDTYHITDHSQGTGAINSVTVYIRTKGTSAASSAPTLVGSWTGETDFGTNGFNYTPGAGSNRVALVMVTAESNSTPIANINEVTLGGQALTAVENADGVVVGSAGSFHNLLWFGYLNETDISNMSGNALNITWDTAPTNSPPIMVQAATYQNVGQTTPIADSASNTNTVAGSIQAGSVSVGSDDKLVYVTISGQPSDHTAPGGYTEQIEQDGPANSHSNASVHRDATTASTENPTATWSGTNRLAIISAVLNAVESGSSVAAAEVTIRTYDTDYFGSYTSSLPISYTDISATWTENPNTNNDWTWTEIDALEAGVRQYDLGTGRVRTTHVYVEVDYGTDMQLQGEVPTGDLFDITPDDDYSGDLAVKVYLTNTGALVKAYQYLNMKLFLEGSVEAGETPNYQLLTLDNGEATFNLKNYSPGTYTLSVIGGSYSLVSTEPSEWQVGWTVIPEFYCLIMQRSE